MVTWVLERDVFSEPCFNAMVEHLRAGGIPHHIVRIVPFAHTIDGVTPRIDGPVVIYGSIGSQDVAVREGWRPGVFTDPALFNYMTYRDRLGDLFFNADAVAMPISKVPEWLAATGNLLFFIKPTADDKAFAGEVLEDIEFTEWFGRLKHIGYIADNDMEVAVASSKALGKEWRMVVVDGQVVAGTLYKQWMKVTTRCEMPADVVAVALEAHRRFAPASVYVVDIADTADGLKVLEYNTFNSAGLYACDVGAIIDSINAYIKRAI